MFAVNRHATVASVSGHVQTGRVVIVEPGKVETDGGVGEETREARVGAGDFTL